MNLPEWIDRELWDEYVQQRKNDKKEMSPRSALGRLKRLYELKAAGHDPNACIEEALNCHWLDFYVPREKQIDRAVSTQAQETSAYLASKQEIPQQTEAERVRIAEKLREAKQRIRRVA